MEWLLIVVIAWGEAPVVYEREFTHKEECVYIGNWFVDTKLGNWKVYPKAKCFEVKKNVQTNK